MQVSLLLSSLVLTISGVAGHGYLQEPLPSFGPDMKTTYVGIIQSSTIFPGKKFDDNPENNAKMFSQCFKDAGMTTIKTLVDKVEPGCGNTKANGAVRDVSTINSVKWGNDEYKEGFTPTHSGPCEVYIDDKMAFRDENCADKFKGQYPAVIPMDYKKYCSGKCLLTLYWIALHQPAWQAYKQCVPIQIGAGGGTPAAPGTTSAYPAAAPAPTPNTPGGNNTAPSVPSTPNAAPPANSPPNAAPPANNAPPNAAPPANNAPPNAAPPANNAPPNAAPPAPAPKKKCNVRM